jgi:methionyl-tRNA formyltransferase
MKKIAFLGSKPIGYKCLDYLLKNQKQLNCEVIAVFSNDNPTFDANLSIKKLANEYNIPFAVTLDDILNFDKDIDFIISVQYHLILKAEHIAKAKILAFNLHMAPLPEYRGCNQFSFAIFNQAKVFGTTIHQLEAGIDNGKIIAERRFSLTNNMMVKDLYDKTFEESVLLFEENIENIIAEKINFVPQENLIAERGTNIYYRKDISKLKEINLGNIGPEIALKVKATSMPNFEPPFAIIDGVKYFIIHESQYKTSKNLN